VLLGGAALIACPCPHAIAAISSPANWNYACTSSASSSWGGTCGSGRAQSPIDVPMPPPPFARPAAGDLITPATPPLIQLCYPRSARGAVLNPGHGTPEVVIEDEALLSAGSSSFALVQYHFHTQSEHALNGRRQAAEAHLVHVDPITGAFAVLAVLLQPGKSRNMCLQAALDAAVELPPDGTPVPLRTPLPLTTLLPRGATGAAGFPCAFYGGSLTTPPCSEAVRWFIALEAVEATAEQLLALEAFAGGGRGLGSNARPLQPLNGRTVGYGTGRLVPSR
jgi:carbonic anhydrase